MLSKWKIKICDNYVFGEDGELYRLPFVSKNRSYGLRKIKVRYPNRWVINGEVWSKRQLKSHIYLDPDPIELFNESDSPFEL